MPNVVIGSKIWVEDSELAWIAADVTNVESDKVTARTEKNKKLVCNCISFLRIVSIMHVVIRYHVFLADSYIHLENPSKRY
jgi:t-SNARE complex subunit (syntaxin)